MLLENTKELSIESENGFYKDIASSPTKQSYLVFKTSLPPPKQAFLPKRCIYCGESVELLDKQTTIDINATHKLLSILVRAAYVVIIIVAIGLFFKNENFILDQLISLALILIGGVAVVCINIAFLNKQKTTFNYGVCNHHQNPIINKVIKYSTWSSYLALIVLLVLWAINMISLFTLTILLVILLFAMFSVYRSRKFIVFDSQIKNHEATFWIKILGVSEQFFTDLPAVKDKERD